MTTPRQLPLAVRLTQAPGFEQFAAGPDGDALGAVRAHPARGGAALLLLGPTGSGKSHLLMAAANAHRARGDGAYYLPLSALAAQTPESLDGYPDGALLCIDEIEAVAGRRDWDVALARRLDAARSGGGSLLLAARGLPETMLRDLRTRLDAAARFTLQAPDDARRRQALQLRARHRGLQLGDEVADYLIRRLPRDMGSLMQALDALDAASLSAQRRVTIPFVQQTLPAIAPSSAQTAPG